MGRPTAARIISLVQPAQQQYFRVSSTDTARLVSALVMSLRRARWAASHPVPADLTPNYDIVQDSELARFDSKYLGASALRAR